MRKRDWLPYIAVGGCLIWALSSDGLSYPGQPNSGLNTPSQTEPSASQPQQEQSSPAQTPSPTGTPQHQPEAVQDAPGSSPETDYRKEDLKAQRRMADAADEMNRIGWYQYYGLLAEAILIFLTLIATGFAVREAAKAVRVAHESVQVDERIGHAQVRAYVQLSEPTVSIVTHTGANYGNHPWIKLSIRNSGASPARFFRWSAIVAYEYSGSEFDIRGSLDFPNTNWGMDIASQTAEPLQPHLLPATLKTADVAAFKTGQLHMFTSVKTSYFDVFNVEHTEERHYGAYFRSGDLGIDYPLHRWPLGVKEMAAQKQPQPNPQQ